MYDWKLTHEQKKVYCEKDNSKFVCWSFSHEIALLDFIGLFKPSHIYTYNKKLTYPLDTIQLQWMVVSKDTSETPNKKKYAQKRRTTSDKNKLTQS